MEQLECSKEVWDTELILRSVGSTLPSEACTHFPLFPLFQSLLNLTTYWEPSLWRMHRRNSRQQPALLRSHQGHFPGRHEVPTWEWSNAHLLPRPSKLFPELPNMIIASKRPGLVLCSRYNPKINLILLVVHCISIFIFPRLTII